MRIVSTIEQLQVEVQTNAKSAVSGLDALASSLGELRKATKGGLGLTAVKNQLNGISSAVDALKSVDISGVKDLGTSLSDALSPLATLTKSNLSSFITPLQKLPKVMEGLNAVDMGAFAAKIREVTNAVMPLATEMQKVANGFSAFPAKIQKLISSTNKLSASNTTAATSYVNFAAKITTAVYAVKRLASVVASWISKSNEYVEDLNLFNVSMGQFAVEAKEYAETVADIMGIDPAEWMRDQGIFMTLATGFGVASDRAYTMSKNLTQLTYDLSSFFNISYDEAFQKLQSGLAGELEPLRRLGYDLSAARLQQEAYRLGIEKKVSTMTQAEKAELRYYAIMTQVTTAQGDMARTLDAPANQIRIFTAQLTQCARALGNIFIPVLNKVLPYAIAFVKVIRVAAELVGQLVGFTLPEIDYSNVNTIPESLEDANKEAKKLKNSMLGIDELNVLSQDDSSSDDTLGGLSFDLPEYDFVSEAVQGKVDEIVEKMKEWLGLTDDIQSWGDFFDTTLGKILKKVGLIGAGIALWKVTKGFIDTVTTLKTLLANPSYAIAIGATIAIVGFTLSFEGLINAFKEGVNKINFAEILAGGVTAAGGLALFGAKLATWITTAFAGTEIAAALSTAATNLGVGSVAAAGAALGAAVAGIIVGIPMMFVGIYDAIVREYNWMNSSLVAMGGAAAGAGVGAIIGALGGPIGAGAGALIGLVVGLIADGIVLIIKNWDAIKVFFTETLPQWAKTAVSSFAENVRNAFENLNQWVKDLPEKVRTKLNEISTYLDELPDKIKAWFDGTREKIKTWFSNLWQPIKDFDWKGLGEDVGEWFGNAIHDAYIFVTESIPNWFKDTKQSFVDGFDTFFNETLPTLINETLPQVIDDIANFFKSLPEKIGNVITSVWDGIKGVGEDILNGIFEGLNTIGTAIKDFVDGFVQGFKDALGIKSPSKVFKEIGGFIIDGFLAPFKFLGKVKEAILGWGSSVVSWFKENVSYTKFKTLASNTINGFKDKIKNGYTNIKSTITTWGSSIVSWFKEYISFDKFKDIASDVINGFKDGIVNIGSTVKDSVTDWASSVGDWFKDTLGIHSPSRVFYDLAGYTVDGFNNGIERLGTSTKGVVGDWTDSFTSVTPTMAFAVDTSALQYYNSDSFAKSVSANVNSTSSVTAVGFKEGMEEFYNEYVAPTMSQMASDMRRQADKNEQTVVQIGNRTVSNAVSAQRKANGYAFAK